MVQAGDEITPVVGLEIHVELATETKMFCRCRNNFGDAPNTNVCPVCLGMPGVLPVMNRKAIEFSMKAAAALNCTLAPFTKWDRKGYYYPDLPKNYQISQYDLPIGSDGYIEVPLSDGTTRKIRIRRAHLEEDAGKNVHDNPGWTGVDLNRAGVPLLEIVSEPDITSAEQAGAYGRAMQRLMRWLGISHANMQMGHMRFEPNINLHIKRGGKIYKTPIVEVKNLNSFKALEGAVEYELTRQYEQWCDDPEGFSLEKLGKQNRGWDDVRIQTVFQREKEEAHDYRYFPDPDLVPVQMSAGSLEQIVASVGELPIARRARYMESLGLSFKDADALTQDAATGDMLDSAVSAGADPKKCVNLLLGRGAAIANEKGCAIAEIGLTAAQLGELGKMMADGKVGATAAAKIFDMICAGDGRSPADIAQVEGLLTVTDSSAMESWVDQAIADNPAAVADVKSGGKQKEKAFGFLTGQVMRKSKGAANPAMVKELLTRKLEC